MKQVYVMQSIRELCASSLFTALKFSKSLNNSVLT